MNLSDALHVLAEQLNLDADSLIAFANEDAVGGFHADAAQSKWQVGSIWGVEGQVLYALTRALQPRHIAEFGVNAGCSSTHFLTALAANETSGELHSIDPWEGAGQAIPSDLREGWNVHYTLGTEWLAAQPDHRFDILFEDMIHGAEATRDWWVVAQQKIAPGGVILSHDATHPSVGAEVQQGIREAGVTDVILYSIEPSDCGLAIWRDPRSRLKPDMSLTKEELKGVIKGDVLEVKPDGETKLNRRRAPDKPTRKPTTAKKPTATKKTTSTAKK